MEASEGRGDHGPRGHLDRLLQPGLDVSFGLAQTQDAIAFLPLATLLEEADALEALEDIAFDDEAATGLEAVVLGHKEGWIRINSACVRVGM